MTKRGGTQTWRCPLVLKNRVYYTYIDGFMQNCSNSIANALELLQSCSKPLMYSCAIFLTHGDTINAALYSKIITTTSWFPLIPLENATKDLYNALDSSWNVSWAECTTLTSICRYKETFRNHAIPLFCLMCLCSVFCTYVLRNDT